MEISVFATVLVALITAVIGPSALEYVKSLIRKKEKQASNDDPMYNEMIIDITINEQIQFLLNELKCDRVWIMQFHNGGHYYTSGLSIKKFSIFFEVTGTGIAPIREKFQGIPTSFFSRSIKEVHDNDTLCIENMRDESAPTFGLRDTAEGTGCVSLMMTALRTPSGKLHGALGVEFVKEPHQFLKEHQEIVEETASYISGALEIIHKFK